MIDYPNIDPVILHIYGNIAIRWYSIAYIIGAAAAYASLYYHSLKFKKDTKNLDSIIAVSVLCMIAFSRITYVFVYSASYYLAHPIEILCIWQGGLSFHGGIIGVIIGASIASRFYKVSAAFIFDSIAVGIPIAIFFGRIANLVNGELFGRETDAYFAMIFPTDYTQVPRHPSQIYEALLEGLALFAVMVGASKTKYAFNRPLFLSGVFLVGYAVFRAISECFREPDAQLGFIFGSITMGQIMSVITLVVGVVFLVYSLVCKQNKC